MQPYHRRTPESTMKLNVTVLLGLLLVCALLGIGLVSAAAAEAQRQQSSQNRHQPVGSWLVTYDVPAFLVPIPLLLSFGRDGVVIETDSPAPTPVGAWER